MRHIIPISGKDSLATAIIQRTRFPEQAYEYVYSDTRLELPETYEWIKKVESTLGIKIKRLGRNLEEIIANYGILPSPRIRYCTREAKIFPMQDYVGKDEAMLYIGIRADEDRVGAREEINIKVDYPLKTLGLKLADVYAVVNKFNLMPPSFFWERLFNAVRGGAWRYGVCRG
jgi:3'-phosphoadenosine 5'-phosphosulfate sulfotransferase (PAPS reductase)/FAD synthetase